jgi:hypothetical protein
VAQFRLKHPKPPRLVENDVETQCEKATAPWRAVVGGPVSSNSATMEDFRNVALGRLGFQFSHWPTSPKFAEALVYRR